jgi:hypothetical protein
LTEPPFCQCLVRSGRDSHLFRVPFIHASSDSRLWHSHIRQHSLPLTECTFNLTRADVPMHASPASRLASRLTHSHIRHRVPIRRMTVVVINCRSSIINHRRSDDRPCRSPKLAYFMHWISLLHGTSQRHLPPVSSHLHNHVCCHHIIRCLCLSHPWSFCECHRFACAIRSSCSSRP